MMKRGILLTALVLGLLCVFAGVSLAEGGDGHSMVLPLPDGCVLVAPDGKLLTERGAYSSIASVSLDDPSPEDELFIATPTYDESGSAASLLMSAKGEALSDPIYEELYGENGVIRFNQGGKYGVMDRDLSVIIPCKYTQLVPNGEGGYLGLTEDPYGDVPAGVWYVDLMGAELATGIKLLGALDGFSDGLCTATSFDTGRVGYLSPKGEWAIAPQLEYGGNFKNGRAEACLESGYGIIDKSGNWLLSPKYMLVSTGFGDGNIILASEDEGNVSLIDSRNYQVKTTFSGEEVYFGAYFDRAYVVLYMTDKVELIDEEGNVLLTTGPEGNFDAWFGMGERVVMRDGPAGETNCYLMDVKGKRVAGPYDEISPIGLDARGVAYFAYAVGDPLDADAQVGVMDQDGNVTIQPGVLMPTDYVHGWLIAETDAETGFCDVNGNWLVKLPTQPGQEEAGSSAS